MIHCEIAETLEEIPSPALVEQLMRTADATLEQADDLQAIGLAQSRAQVEATLVLADDAQLRELNRTYLGIDAPTDVLAFPSNELDPETESLYLGDVILSVERAAAQAQSGGHSLEAELQLLVAHGMLHLCGYDHAEAQDKQRMWEKQASILRSLDCPIEGPGFEGED